MTTTPPVRQIVNTPPTPLHGAKYDTYQPYPTRKSTRSSAQTLRYTPPLETPDRKYSKRATRRGSAPHTYSPPSSAQTSPQNKITGRVRKPTVQQVSSKDDLFGADPAADLGSPHDSSDLLSTMITKNMLPTPAKTPRKKASKPAVGSTGRVLFPVHPDNVEEPAPSPRKRARNKSHTSSSLGRFGEDDNLSPDKIEIFTDSRDKLPELDESENNPFYIKPDQVAASTAPKRSSKRKKAKISTDGSEGLEEALKREDGMVYVFRGKKIFRKFEDKPENTNGSPNGVDSEDLDNVETGTDGSPGLGRLTRSSIKPRLLFPSTEQRQSRMSGTISDEEASTDIEGPHSRNSEMANSHADADAEEERIVTPVKPAFAPVSPPISGHATRSTTKRAALPNSPNTPKTSDGLQGFASSKKRRSPFDTWQRTKSDHGAPNLSNGRGKKREGELIEKSTGGAKKVKTNGT